MRALTQTLGYGFCRTFEKIKVPTAVSHRRAAPWSQAQTKGKDVPDAQAAEVFFVGSDDITRFDRSLLKSSPCCSARPKPRPHAQVLRGETQPGTALRAPARETFPPLRTRGVWTEH